MPRNRQFVIDHLPTGKLTPDVFRLGEGAMPTPGDGEVLLRTRYISLDAANRAWMWGATYRAAIKAGDVMAGGGARRGRGEQGAGLRPRRPRLRRHWLAGLCRPSRRSISPSSARRRGADHLPDERLRHCRSHRLFRPARMRPAESGRDCRRVRRCRIRRLVRRTDREDQRLPHGRHRGRRRPSATC